VLIHLGLQSGLHQVLGQLRQQTALAHQPQPVSADLLGRERGQLLQQLTGQTVLREGPRQRAVRGGRGCGCRGLGVLGAVSEGQSGERFVQEVGQIQPAVGRCPVVEGDVEAFQCRGGACGDACARAGRSALALRRRGPGWAEFRKAVICSGDALRSGDLGRFTPEMAQPDRPTTVQPEAFA
jgi:hypothetical protein